MKIDIYNFILNNMQKILHLKSNNTKYNHKIIFDSLIYILKSGISWNSKIILNEHVIFCNSIYKHFIRLTKLNFFSKILNKIKRKFLHNNNAHDFVSVDSTFIPNKYCYHNNKIKRNPYKSNKFGYKISIITNQQNIPLDILFSNGNDHDLTILNKHINKPTMRKYLTNKYLLADKGYKSNKLKSKLIDKFNCHIILPNTKSFHPDTHLKSIYKKRIFIEHLFSKIKNYKRLANNYEKCITNFYSFVYLSLIQLCIIREKKEEKQ